MKQNQGETRSIELLRYRDSEFLPNEKDETAAEEPLEIRVEGRSVAVVMRTPGHDRELAAGFALTEGIIANGREIFEITQCLTNAPERGTAIEIFLRDPAKFDLAKLSRHLFTSSSCGVCGKATIASAMQLFPPIIEAPVISVKTLLGLPEKLRAAQETFRRTGGLHACALFERTGRLLLLREDVGRHNALDKLIGHELLADHFSLGNTILLLSGRVSFEMMQKALAARIAIVAAISAPTSLAVEFARASNQTLVGFLRGETMNIYAGSERVRVA